MLLSLGSTSTNGRITELPPHWAPRGPPRVSKTQQEGKPRGRSRDDGHVITPCPEFRATFQKPPKALPGHRTSLLESLPDIGPLSSISAGVPKEEGDRKAQGPLPPR